MTCKAQITIMKKPITRKDDIVIRRIKGEILIYDTKDNKAFCLNETSALIYDLCDGKHSISEISDALSERLTILVSKELVSLALDQLDRDGLLEGGTDDHFEGMSRRAVIRKLGATSLAALPAISLIVAPNAAAAQSCSAPGASIPITFPNPTIQTDIPACRAYCGFASPGVPALTEPLCCSGLARSNNGFNLGNNTCTCSSYACVVS